MGWTSIKYHFSENSDSVASAMGIGGASTLAGPGAEIRMSWALHEAFLGTIVPEWEEDLLQTGQLAAVSRNDRSETLRSGSDRQ